MNRTPVNSSSIASVGYEPQTATLEIEFVDGGVYQYFDVPEHEHEALIGAGSVGSYFATQIKGIYRYARV
jgi:hypothetical protein